MQTSVIHWVELGDHRLMRQVNRWREGWRWYGIGAVVALFGGPERFAALLATATAVGCGIALFLKLKRSFGRKRPMEPHCWATLLPPDQFSFPSGHTITAFAVAISLGTFYPAMRAELLFCAGS